VALDSILSTPVIPPPPKGATSPTTGDSSGSDGSSSSTTTSSASGPGTADAASNSNGSAAKSSRGNSASRSAKSNSQAQSASSSSSSKAPQSSATHQAQAGASNARAATQNKNPGPSFVEALAQTQADAQDSAAATAADAPQEVTGSKPKGAKDDHSDTTGTALGFLSQSLAAAMAGLQPTNPGQSPQTTSDDDSTDTILLAGGGAGSSTIQSVVANIAQRAAEELAHGSSGLKAATPASPDDKADLVAPTTDNTAAAAGAFQAHMVTRAQASPNAEALGNKVSTPVGEAGFTDEVGDKITWMANHGVQSASLQLTPEHLGPVEVRISVQNGSASVSFNAAHADTRAALEQTLPRLREMFSTQGLTLTDASVSQQSPRGQPQRQTVSAIGAIGGVPGDDSTSSVASVTRVQLGLVDTYA
jgi:flagellar hook-length control protein FliK